MLLKWFDYTLAEKRDILYRYIKNGGEKKMDVNVGDTLVMKKNHPCGSNRFLVLRAGMDFKIKCEGCSHELMTPRIKVERNIKKIIKKED